MPIASIAPRDGLFSLSEYIASPLPPCALLKEFSYIRKRQGAGVFVHPKKAVNVRKPELSLSVKGRG